MANFGNKNETFAYLVGKDIAEIKAKIENIGTTSGGLDVLKVVVPAATNEDFDNRSLYVVPLPKEFQNALLMYEQYGGWMFIISEKELGIPLESAEKETYFIKITDFKNPKETTHAIIRNPREGGGGAASDA